MKSYALSEAFHYSFLFRGNFNLHGSIVIPTLLVLLSLFHVLFFAYFFPLFSQLDLDLFCSLSVHKVLLCDFRPHGSFFNIFDEIVAPLQEIFFLLTLKVYHFVYYNTCLMIIIDDGLDIG
jgi:hypothetical protein